jgi:isopenicillin-N N-acyltransferase-like protein
MSRGVERIVVRGDPYARGWQYGLQGRPKIHRALALYQEAFRHRAALEWEAALVLARAFTRDIAAFSPDALQEMRGIADGADVGLDAILALNCRSELMFAAAPEAPPEGECTAFAVVPTASANGHTLLGQNWDWVSFAREVCVLLEAHRDDKPDFVTVVEAGMLAKVGFNAAGLGLCTNTLVSAGDAARRGVPYHVMLRALLDAETIVDARRTLLAPERALSANYLIAHRSGEAANFETTGGGSASVRITAPEHGWLAHANHFVDPAFATSDSYIRQSPHSYTRLESMRAGLTGRGITLERLRETLRSHHSPPNGICSHPDPGAHPMSARTTVASVIADLTAGDAWIAEGPPCSTEYERYPLHAIFGGWGSGPRARRAVMG